MLEIVGERWSLLIIRNAMFAPAQVTTRPGPGTHTEAEFHGQNHGREDHPKTISPST